MTPFLDCRLRFGALKTFSHRFCVGGGRRNFKNLQESPLFKFLLYALVWCSWFNGVSAQSTVLWEANCGQLILEVEPLPYTGNINQTNCAPCCAGQITCERIEYTVWLRAVGAPGNSLPSGGNFTLSYSELYITLNLDRDNNAVVSVINEALTKACLANYLVDAADDFEANSSEDEVSLRLSSLTGEIVPGIPFVNGRSDGPLFSIIVDAFPGEKFGIAAAEFTYVSGANCTNQTCDCPAPAIFPEPNQDNTSLTLSLGDIDCQPETFVDLPVVVTSTLVGTISLFDFAVVVTGNAPDGFFAEPEVVNILNGAVPDIVNVMPVPGGGGYTINLKYFVQDAAPFAGIDIPICTIRIYRPPNLCQGYTISAELKPGRIRLNTIVAGMSGCRAIQTGAITAECIVPEVAICEDFQFNLTAEPVDPNNCSELIAYARFGWDPADFNNQTMMEFEVLRIMLDFELGAGVSIASITLEGIECADPVNLLMECNGISCPPPPDGNSVNFCVAVVSAHAIEVMYDARIKIVFNAPNGCVGKATVRKVVLKVKNQLPVCQPDINPPVGFPFCPPLIQGDIATELNCWVENVTVAMTPAGTNDPSCFPSVLTGYVGGGGSVECGPYGTCVCSQYTYTVRPRRADNLLNGVSTFDLVLISKHILGLEPLGSPYKMIAADANKSNSITTADIVEFRKLILGIYDNGDSNPLNDWPTPPLGNNAYSWRFVDKSYIFPDPDNPFLMQNPPNPPFPEEKTVTAPDLLVDFVAIKTGDVNNSAIVSCLEANDECHAFERPMGEAAWYEPQRNALKSGEYYTLPVYAGGDKSLIAWQTALRFDPDLLELIGPSLGDLPDLSVDNFNLAQAGEGIIRALWFAQSGEEDAALQPGQVLFYLTFRTKQEIAATTSLLKTDDKLMSNLGWTNEGSVFHVKMPALETVEYRGEVVTSVAVRCRPNPGSGEITFDIIELPQAKRAQLNVLDAFGRRVWSRDLNKESGPLQIVVPEAASWPAGIYHWELRHDRERTRGTFIRQ